jgi:phage tail-like protein
MAGIGNPPDPLRSYAFKIYIPDFGDEALAHFTDCSSLTVQVAAIKYTEGGNSPITYKLPGAVTYGDVTLKYGLTTSTDMYNWFLAGVHGRIDYRHVSIAMQDTQGQEKFRWDLINAWPSTWTGAPLSAAAQTIAVEQVTVVYSYMKRPDLET